MVLAETNVVRTSLLIVDDHRMFAESLVRLLSDESDLVVVGVAYTIVEAERLVRAANPDLVVLDYRLPDGDAPTCMARLRAIAPDVCVLVLTGLNDDETLAAARAAGPQGVVTKDRAAGELVEAIRLAANGTLVAGTPSRDRSADATGHLLSPREREVLSELANGRTTAEMAATLGISAVTVRNHIQRILAKLGAHSRLEAVAVGTRLGVIAPRRRGAR